MYLQCIWNKVKWPTLVTQSKHPCNPPVDPPAVHHLLLWAFPFRRSLAANQLAFFHPSIIFSPHTISLQPRLSPYRQISSLVFSEASCRSVPTDLLLPYSLTDQLVSLLSPKRLNARFLWCPVSWSVAAAGLSRRESDFGSASYLPRRNKVSPRKEHDQTLSWLTLLVTMHSLLESYSSLRG